MDMTIDCPHCGTPLRVPETAAGRRGRCTECDQRFMIPSLEEMLDSTVSHFMVATIDAADDAEDAFEEALGDAAYATAPSSESTGTVAGIPVVPAHQASDDSRAPLTTDNFGPSRHADHASHDHADLIDITDDIQHEDLAEDALNDAPPADPIDGPDDDDDHAAHYPTELIPSRPRPYLVVRAIGLEGVRIAFDARWLKDEAFRVAMPLRCAFTGEADPDTLIARAIIFLNKHTGPETPLHSIESRHELHLATNPSPRGIARSMGRLDDFAEPFDRPLLYYVSPGAQPNSIEATAHTPTGGSATCEVVIPHHRTALEWVERVNGCCGPEIKLLHNDMARYASDAWRRLPERVRQRLGIWCRFEHGETFKLYLKDPDFTTKDAGLAGVVVTNRRLIYHKFRRSRSVSLNQDALLHVSTDAKVARLTLQSLGRAARCGKIHKADVPHLIEALSDAPKLRVEVRSSQTSRAPTED